MANNEFLKVLSELNGVPGNETQVKNFMKAELTDIVDEISYDNIGSIIGKKVGNPDGPRVMVAGHMDEVGFMVTKIDKDGYIKIHPLGGWWGQVVLAQQVTITTTEGSEIHGVIGSKPPHILTPEERKKPTEIKNVFVDIGVKDKAAAEELGILTGDMVTPYIEFREMANPDYLLGKAWDDRIGCAIAIEVAKNLKNEKHDNIYYAVGTVQEEVGTRGAGTTANFVDPDIGIALDVTIATDIPGGDGLCKFGEGPQILVYDGALVGHRGLRKHLLEVAEKHEIPVQVGYLARGGTDAGKMSLAHSGAPAVSICLPARYIHSHTSMIHRKDYEATIKLVTELVKSLDRETVNKITY
ncbi:M42 family metallopeptidase [Mycoplasmatota bacterium]|nr:M42 family metallopeptidase [Mycoplasmatota bacterium]